MHLGEEWKPRGVTPATISKIISASNKYSGPRVWNSALNFFMNDPVFDDSKTVDWFLKATLPGGESKVKIPVDELHLKAATWASSIFGKGPTRSGLTRFISKHFPTPTWRGRYLAFRADAEDYIAQSEATSGMLTDEQITDKIAKIESFQKSSAEYEKQRGAAPINFRVPFTDVKPPPRKPPAKKSILDLRNGKDENGVDENGEENLVGRTVLLLGIAGIGIFFLTRGGLPRKATRRARRR